MSSSALLGSGSARGNTSVVLIVGVDLVNPLPLLPFLQVKESKLVQEQHYPINTRVSIRNWLHAAAPSLVIQERIFQSIHGRKCLVHIKNFSVTEFDVVDVIAPPSSVDEYKSAAYLILSTMNEMAPWLTAAL